MRVTSGVFSTLQASEAIPGLANEHSLLAMAARARRAAGRVKARISREILLIPGRELLIFRSRSTSMRAT